MTGRSLVVVAGIFALTSACEKHHDADSPESMNHEGLTTESESGTGNIWSDGGADMSSPGAGSDGVGATLVASTRGIDHSNNSTLNATAAGGSVGMTDDTANSGGSGTGSGGSFGSGGVGNTGGRAGSGGSASGGRTGSGGTGIGTTGMN